MLMDLWAQNRYDVYKVYFFAKLNFKQQENLTTWHVVCGMWVENTLKYYP